MLPACRLSVGIFFGRGLIKTIEHAIGLNIVIVMDACHILQTFSCWAHMFQSEMHEFHNTDDTHNWQIIEREKKERKVINTSQKP